MTNFLIRALRLLGRTTRQLASLGLLFLAVRFAWLAGDDVLQALAAETEALGGQGATEQNEPGTSDLGAGLTRRLNKSQHRPDLAELKDAAGGDMAPSELAKESQRHATTLRRLLVDVGAERSDVYVNGRNVGRVPYVGQITCNEGSKVTIQVLPPSGAPLTREATCRGTTILVR